MSGFDTHYSARDIETRILAGLRAAGLNPDQRLTPEQLGALDHFHTGGLPASRELLELAGINAADRVSVFVDNLGTKAANARRSLEEGQVRFCAACSGKPDKNCNTGDTQNGILTPGYHTRPLPLPGFLQVTTNKEKANHGKDHSIW